MHSPSFYDRHNLQVADARAAYLQTLADYRSLQKVGLQSRLQDCVEAFGGILCLHARDGNECAVCRTPYPCATIRLIPDEARGGADTQ